MPKLQDASERQKVSLASKTRAGVVVPSLGAYGSLRIKPSKVGSGMEAYSSSASRNENENVRRYGLAILAAIIALMLRQLLTPLLGESYPYHTPWAATVF